MAGCTIPNIQEFHGRLFLCEAAYAALKYLIKDDGEFIPVSYEKGAGYIFNPLRIGEDLEGLNKALCVTNEWDDIENMGFHEEKLNSYAIFKTKFDSYNNFYCRQDVIDAIENSSLKGVKITPELGARFGMTKNQKNAPH